MASEQEEAWRGLHVLSLAVNLLPRMWSAARQIWPLLLAVWFGGTSESGLGSVELVVLGAFFAFTTGGTLLHFFTLRYRVQDGRLVIVSGLFNRQTRVISPERIQNIERVRNVFHRVTNLVEVRIETASGGDVEGLLSALDNESAESLIRELDVARSNVVSDPTEEVVLVHDNDLWDLFRYGITAMRLGAVAVVVGLAFEGLQFLEPESVEDLSDVMGVAGGFFLLIAVASGVWLTGVMTTVARFRGYTLTESAGILTSEQGLFTRRRVELPVGKVQLVRILEPIVRRALGFGSVSIETAAARNEEGGTQRAEAMIPVVEYEDQDDVVSYALPTFRYQELANALRPPHRKALYRGLSRAVGQGALLGALVCAYAGLWGMLGFIAIPVLAGIAWLDHVNQGWLVTEDLVISRHGFLRRRTDILARRKIQALEVIQGPIMRRWGLGKVVLRVAGNAVVLPDLSFDHAWGILEELKAPEKSSASGLPLRPGKT